MRTIPDYLGELFDPLANRSVLVGPCPACNAWQLDHPLGTPFEVVDRVLRDHMVECPGVVWVCRCGVTVTGEHTTPDGVTLNVPCYHEKRMEDVHYARLAR